MKPSPKLKIGLPVLAGFVVYALLARRLPTLLGETGRSALVIRVVLLVVGFVVATILYWYLQKKMAAVPAAPTDAMGEELDAAVASARTRLARSSVGGGAALATLPTIVLLGPERSGKTTTVVRSPLEAELLAGEAMQGEQTVPTRLANLWYMRGTVVAEAGVGVTAEPSRWTRLLQRLRPQRLRAALGRGVQAPRVAVVCFACDELLKPGAADAVPEAARRLRALLAGAADAFGIRLPVYVVFTKLDKIQGFAEFVQNLTRDEIHQVLGATLPATRADDGVYAERESRRLSAMLHAMVESLAARRLLVLAREHAAERKPGAYEFPRELRKVVPLVSQFLVELGRPAQLQVSPFLRGFYFTGVRAIVVSDVAAAPAASVASAPSDRTPGPAGATGVFNIPRVQAPEVFTPVVPRGRRKPEWVFLDRLLPDVILADGAALRATSGGTRVSGLQRAMVGSAAVVALVLAAGFTVSWLGNRRLEARTLAAVRATEGVTAAGALPAAEPLRRLDSLRARVATLDGYERSGRPFSLGLGLYTGDDLQPHARRLYFDRFARLLLDSTRARMAGTLRTLPDSATATAEYGPTYELLKAYLLVHGEWARSASDFPLAPVLVTHWLGDRSIDAERDSLVRRQFEYYASELPRGDPLAAVVDTGVRDHARGFLRSFGSDERIYRLILAEAERKGITRFQFNRAHAGYAQFVDNRYEVPGAFTKDGWTFVQAQLDSVGKYMGGDDWVLGPDTTGGRPSAAQVSANLHRKYEGEFVLHWREYLKAGRVIGFANAADADRRLQALGSATSPLLTMIADASRNTAVDSASPVRRAFQPLHAVSPPEIVDKLQVPANEAYMQALVKLQGDIKQVIAAKGPDVGGAAQTAIQSADQARMAVGQLATSFAISDTTRVAAAEVQRLLLRPIEELAFLANLGTKATANAVNEAGASFCKGFNEVLSKFPFTASSKEDAKLGDVKELLGPGGALDGFYNEWLQQHFSRQLGKLSAKPGSTVRPNPAFTKFYERATAAGSQLFRDGSAVPKLDFSVRGLPTTDMPSVKLTVGPENQAFTKARQTFDPFHWAADKTPQNASLTVVVGNQPHTLFPKIGPWALFRLFSEATTFEARGDKYLVEWPAMAGSQHLSTTRGPLKVQLELDLMGAEPVLRPRYFEGLRCVPQVTM